MPFFTACVAEDIESIRVDKYIASLPNAVNRSRLKSGVTRILVNAKPAKLSSKVRAGDIIDVEWEEDIPDDIQPQNIPLKIIYEDDNVTVVDKEQGMVTHPAAGNWNNTLVNALLYHWGKTSIEPVNQGAISDILASRRPGIVHRLDKDTSGVIIAARNRASEEWLQKQFQNRRVKKEYIAIVYGRPPASCGSIKTQIFRDPRNRKLFKADTESQVGKFAHTDYRCIACYGPFSLMRLRLKTGRTHQIRVHMKYLGCPILGDPLYGRREKNGIFPEATLMLHARLLSLRLPGTDIFTDFKAPVPIRFKSVLRVLHQKYEKCVLK